MRKFLAVLTVTLAFSAGVRADVIFEIEQKEMNPESTGQIKGKVKGDTLRLDIYEDAAAPDGSMIYKGASKEMIMIDHDDKSYIVLDEAAMNALASQLQQMMSQMEEAMKNLPPDQREKMKEMMGGKAGETYVEPVIKKAGSGKVNGISCEKYDVYKGDEKVAQHCVAAWGSIDGGQEMMNIMLQMGDSMDKMVKSFSAPGSPMGSEMEFQEGVFNQMRKLNGFPVETTIYDEGAVESVATLKSSQKGTVDPADLEPPAGYTKQSTSFN